MLDRYVCNYTADFLHTLIRIWSTAHPDSVRMDHIVDFSDMPFGPAAQEHAPDLLGERSCCIFSLAGDFAYCILVSRNDSPEEWALLGPLRFDAPVFFQHSLGFCQIGIHDRPEHYDDWLKSVPVCHLEDLISCLMLLLNAGQNEADPRRRITREQILVANCINPEKLDNVRREFAKTSFEQLEEGIVHNPWNHELRQTLCIEHGDVEGLRKVLQENFTGRFGTLARSPLRQAIDIGIVTITVASRAAIRGGLHAETAFYLSDISIQNMEKCSDVETVEQIYNDAQFHYAELVRDLKKELPEGNPKDENEHIAHCKDYIYTHLHGVLTVSEIADAIGLNASYLSSLFRKTCGVSLKEYILRRKIDLAKNLLIYSSYSLPDIAGYLGFSSQCHLIREFRRFTGQTPARYRKLYTPEDFIRDSL